MPERRNPREAETKTKPVRTIVDCLTGSLVGRLFVCFGVRWLPPFWGGKSPLGVMIDVTDERDACVFIGLEEFELLIECLLD